MLYYNTILFILKKSISFLKSTIKKNVKLFSRLKNVECHIIIGKEFVGKTSFINDYDSQFINKKLHFENMVVHEKQNKMFVEIPCFDLSKEVTIDEWKSLKKDYRLKIKSFSFAFDASSLLKTDKIPFLDTFLEIKNLIKPKPKENCVNQIIITKIDQVDGYLELKKLKKINNFFKINEYNQKLVAYCDIDLIDLSRHIDKEQLLSTIIFKNILNQLNQQILNIRKKLEPKIDFVILYSKNEENQSYLNSLIKNSDAIFYQRLQLNNIKRKKVCLHTASVFLIMFIFLFGNYHSNKIQDKFKKAKQFHKKYNHLSQFDSNIFIFKEYLRFKMNLINHPVANMIGFRYSKKISESLKINLLNRVHNHIIIKLISIFEKELLYYYKKWDLEKNVHDVGQYYLALVSYRALVSNNSNIPPEIVYYFSEKLKNEKIVQLINFYIKNYNKTSVETYQSGLIFRSALQLEEIHDLDKIYFSIQHVLNAHLGNVALTKLIHENNYFDDISIPVIFTSFGWKKFMNPMLSQASSKYLDFYLIRKKYQKSRITFNQLRNIYNYHYQLSWNHIFLNISFKDLDNFEKIVHLLSQDLEPIKHLLKIYFHTNAINQIKQNKLLKAINEPVTNTYKSLKSMLNNFNLNDDRDKKCLEYAKNTLNHQGSHTELIRAYQQIKKIINTINNPSMEGALFNYIRAPLKQIWVIILKHATNSLQNKWEKQFYLYYEQEIIPYFPFENSYSDLSVEMFKKLLEPNNGIIHKIYQSDIKLFIDLQTQTREPKTWLGKGITINKKTIDALKKINHVSKLIFNNGTLKLNLLFYPLPSSGVSEVDLIINDKRIIYKNGKQYWHTIHWPEQNDNQKSLLRITKSNQYKKISISFEGVWSLFRLLKKAKIYRLNETTYRVIWRLKGINISFLMKDPNQTHFIDDFVINPIIFPRMLVLSSVSSFS